jgi:hypothetical protein
MMKSIAAAAIVALALAPEAGADTQYLFCLHKQGIHFGNGPDTETAVGHSVWTSIEFGKETRMQAIYELMREGADSNTAAIIMGCAVAYQP